MSNIVPSRRSAPAAVDRRLSSCVADAEVPSYVGAARVHGGAFVASSAMLHALMLSRTADAAFRISPMGEDIYRSILMAYGAFATAEIQRLGLHGEGGR